MSPASNIRNLTEPEASFVNEVLQRLRDRFAVWDEYGPGDEYELAQFAYYEGCSDSTDESLEAAAPFAVAMTLVEGRWVIRHGERTRRPADQAPFEWCMVDSNRGWSYAIKHELFEQPITLDALLAGEWNREQYDEAITPGEMALDSLDFIEVAARWKRAFGSTTPVPEGSVEKVERALHFRK